MKPTFDEINPNPAWQRQDTGPAIQGAIDWRPLLTRLIATLQQLNDPGLNDDQRIAGLETLVNELGDRVKRAKERAVGDTRPLG